MSTAARKKAKPTIKSTDRGGLVLLVMGVVLVAFGIMLLLATSLQTTSGSLDLLKWLAIGLGGGFYLFVPLLCVWLGALLVISSKRYVSVYHFIISLLLLLSIGALINLTLQVNDRSSPLLMDYIKNVNISRGAPYPDSLGEYLRTSYQLPRLLSSGNRFYTGGGALSMLLTYPLYVTLGNLGAIVLLVMMIIGLGFALVRVSPVKLIHQMSERANQRYTAQPQPVAQAAQQAAYTDVQEGMVMPAQAEPVAAWPAQAQPYTPVFAQEATNTYPVYDSMMDTSVDYAQDTEPGFVAQSQDTMFDTFIDVAPVPVQPTSRLDTSTPARPTASRRRTQAEPVNTMDAPEPMVASAQKPAEDLPWFVDMVEPINQVSPETITEMQQSQTDNKHIEQKQVKPPAVEPVVKPVPEKPIKPVLVQPAVDLTGKRMPVKPFEEKPGKPTLDGMAATKPATQIRLALDDYQTPPLRLLTEGEGVQRHETTPEDLARAEKLIETLKSFSITAHLQDIVHGPTVTRFAIRLAEGINVSKLRSVMDNLTIELKAKGDIRAEMPIPGTSFVGLEVSNDVTSKVLLRDVLESPRMRDNKSPTVVALGKDITGTPIISELMDLPHLLIAGATGSGKSVCINSIICSILYRASPRHVRMIMVDPKFVELHPYNEVPHLLMPVITDAKKATAALDWVCQEMDERYQILVDAGVRNLDAYNKKLGPDEEPLPRIIVIVDEMADLMTTNGKQLEDHIKRITAKARAAGICLILATQRPSVNIITGVIKANIPGRIAFRVSSPFDSKTILDNQGAEKLLGYGDMLYRSTTREPIRVQGCFVSDQDVEQTVDYIRSRNQADYNLDLIEHVEQSDQPEGGAMGDNGDGGDAEFDELLPQAIEMAVEAGQMSISMLQRVLRVGYARSGRLIDEMARRGIISGNEGTKARKTLMTREQYLSYLEHGG